MRPYNTPEFRRGLRLVERNFQSEEQPSYFTYEPLPWYNCFAVAVMVAAATLVFAGIIVEVIRHA